MSALFDRMEESCPGVFRGQTAVTERMGSEWSRNYAGLEAQQDYVIERCGQHVR